jgi:peptide/nickel transport system permease protein
MIRVEWGALGRVFGARILEVLALALAVFTLLFAALRLTGDPAVLLAGEDADKASLAAVRAAYGLDRPLWAQYVAYLAKALGGDFGASLATGQPAIAVVLAAVSNTLLMAGLAISLTIALATPLGVWLGAAPDRLGQRVGLGLLILVQSMPGLVVALVLIQVFCVQLGWLPAMGAGRVSAWILPSVTLATFLVPKLARLIAANIAAARTQDYVRTAEAAGLSPRRILWRHILPNALIGAVALLGAQFSFLVSGAVVTETIFAWPGLGRLLVQSTLTLDFPVVQALVLVICVMVFAAGAAADIAIRLIDPRIRPA